MVLFAPLRIKKLQRDVDEEWEAWLKRRDEAQAKGHEFNEPKPSAKRN